MKTTNVNPFPDINADCGTCFHPLNQHWEVRNLGIILYACPHCNGHAHVIGNPISPNSNFNSTPEYAQNGKSMSALNLCDRCNAFALGKAIGTLGVVPDLTKQYDTDGTIRKELCPACISELVEFLDNAPDREGKAFREPYKPAERKELES